MGRSEQAAQAAQAALGELMILAAMATTEPHATGVRAEDLQPLLNGPSAALRHQVREVLGRPEFEPPIGVPTADYRERVLEAFARAIDEAPEGPVADGVSRLRDVYALHLIELDRGYLQEHRRLTGPRCKAITREVNRLCDEVRGDAAELVDAFGIPDEVLRAPIALR